MVTDLIIVVSSSSLQAKPDPGGHSVGFLGETETDSLGRVIKARPHKNANKIFLLAPTAQLSTWLK